MHVPASSSQSIGESDGQFFVENQHGSWPAAAVDRPFDPQSLWLRLPIGAKAKDSVTASSSGRNRPAELRLTPASAVLETYQGAISLIEGAEDRPGLRPPQVGAIHDLHDAIVDAGILVRLIGGADIAGELDAKRAIDQGARVAALL